MSDWKEQFNRKFEFGEDQFCTGEDNCRCKAHNILTFISHAIIEPLIQEIPSDKLIGDFTNEDAESWSTTILTDTLKQQLRNKWL